MDFKARFSYIFVTQILLIVVLLFSTGRHLFAPVHESGFWRYDYILLALTAFLWLIQFYRSIYACLFNKPILTVNETCIYDFVTDTTYYLKDIEGIYEKKTFLYLNLYNPKDYLDKIGNPHRRLVVKRWFNSNNNRPLFIINTDLIDAKRSFVLEKLNNYRLQALANSN